ncbi:Beta-glucanase precursor [Pseudoruegeria aquimaris]|uniref:Beta-glucanase n=2 Tax=Pseudoruegeria aquimaris TaxID=393663 RepID=A0A1Y5S201_9RHOB|nr:Beta-glucanase precursor [Pseudoruegeria aquimaris]
MVGRLACAAGTLVAGLAAPLAAGPAALEAAGRQGIAAAAGFTERFQRASAPGWHIAEYDFSHPAFDTDWRRANVRIAGGLTLDLLPRGGPGNRFSGGSIRRDAPTGHGRYEAVLRAAGGTGLVTGFFTYTGPAYGSRHDEIDIEILGQSPDHLHAAWFVDGDLQSRRIPLGFDASAGFHHFAFTWEPGRITWEAEGRVLLVIEEGPGRPLPRVPGRLFANLWAADPSIASWAGHTAPATRAQAQFACVAYTPLKAALRGRPPACAAPGGTS